MQIVIGFFIALLVGLTGVGGGSFTTPALVLIAGLSGAQAVGTALAFSTIVRLVAAPFYLAARHVHLRYLKLMLIGAMPGLLAGSYLLATMNSKKLNTTVVVGIGVILVLSSIFTLTYGRTRSTGRKDRPTWVPWLMLPIGVETGFSSAGAGSLATILLMNCSDMPVAMVVGTDLVFGVVLAATGSALHFGLGSISTPVLRSLLLGGIPGVLVGCALAPRVPPGKLKYFIVALTLVLGLRLAWSGLR